jgi:hypothetical protein
MQNFKKHCTQPYTSEEKELDNPMMAENGPNMS